MTLTYITQVFLFQGVFFLLYLVSFRKLTFFQWNRWYLTLSVVISLVLPIAGKIKLSSFLTEEQIQNLPEAPLLEATPTLPAPTTTPDVSSASESVMPDLFTLYLIGVMITGGLFLYKLTRVWLLYRASQKQKMKGYTLVELPNRYQAFSIFNMVFMGTESDDKERALMLEHELVHVRQRHSVDLLFFELLKVVFWFDPLVYLFQKHLRRVHEYIADRESLRSVNKVTYLESLMKSLLSVEQIPAVNNFYTRSLIKKRILMMDKKMTNNRRKLSYMTALPMVLLMLTFVVLQAQEPKGMPDTDRFKEISIKVMEQTKRDPGFNNGGVLKVELLKDGKIRFGDNVDMFSNETIGAVSKYLSMYKKNFIPVEGAIMVRVTGGMISHSNSEVDGWQIDRLSKVKDMEEAEEEFLERDMRFFKNAYFEACASEENPVVCNKQFINAHFKEHFDIEIAKKRGLVGKMRLVVAFEVDKSGNITELRVRASVTCH